MKGLFFLGGVTGGVAAAAAMAAAVPARHPRLLARDCPKVACSIKKMMP